MICSQLRDNTEGKRHRERTGLTGTEELLMRSRLPAESRRIILKGGLRRASRVQEAETAALICAVLKCLQSLRHVHFKLLLIR